MFIKNIKIIIRTYRNLNLFSFFAYIYLLSYLILILSKFRTYLPMKLFYLFRNESKIKVIELLRLLRTIEMAYFYSFKKASLIARDMYSCYENESTVLDLQDRFDIIITAAYAGDVNFLTTLYQDEGFCSDLPGLRQYIKGLIQFNCQDDNWQSSFFECTQNYKQSPIGKSSLIPEYIEHSSNIFPIENYKKHLEAVDLLSSDIPEFSSSDEIVLISCDKDYFIIYSDFFLQRFRLYNNHTVFFIVVLASESDKAKVLEMFETLKLYKNIEIDFVITKYNLALMGSLTRFLKCEKVMTRFGCNIIILDIDMNVDLDINQFTRSVKHNFAFACLNEGEVPWAKLTAGLSMLKFSQESINFLRIYSAYVEYALSNGGQWSLDQLALFLTKDYYEKNIGEILISDSDIKISCEISRLPAKINRQKLLVKSKIPTLDLRSSKRLF